MEPFVFNILQNEVWGISWILIFGALRSIVKEFRKLHCFCTYGQALLFSCSCFSVKINEFSLDMKMKSLELAHHSLGYGVSMQNWENWLLAAWTPTLLYAFMKRPSIVKRDPKYKPNLKIAFEKAKHICKFYMRLYKASNWLNINYEWRVNRLNSLLYDTLIVQYRWYFSAFSHAI